MGAHRANARAMSGQIGWKAGRSRIVNRINNVPNSDHPMPLQFIKCKQQDGIYTSLQVDPSFRCHLSLSMRVSSAVTEKSLVRRYKA
jgi:hypothetical protein